jgi:hypothetical protein
VEKPQPGSTPSSDAGAYPPNWGWQRGGASATIAETLSSSLRNGRCQPRNAQPSTPPPAASSHLGSSVACCALEAADAGRRRCRPRDRGSRGWRVARRDLGPRARVVRHDRGGCDVHVPQRVDPRRAPAPRGGGRRRGDHRRLEQRRGRRRHASRPHETGAGRFGQSRRLGRPGGCRAQRPGLRHAPDDRSAPGQPPDRRRKRPEPSRDHPPRRDAPDHDLLRPSNQPPREPRPA